MFKLIKYELRRNISSIVILLAICTGLECFTLYSILTKNSNNTAISLSLMMFALFVAVFFVFIIAVQSYSKELNSKYSYMAFMTPNSSYKIIGSKLLFTFLLALFITIVGAILIVIDYNIFVDTFIGFRDMHSVINEFFSYMGVNLDEALISILVGIILFWISVFNSISIAYFSITLSATVLANKKSRWIISFIIFVVLNIIINQLTSYIPNLDLGTSLFATLMSPILVYIATLVSTIAAFLGSAKLLEKKVSL